MSSVRFDSDRGFSLTELMLTVAVCRHRRMAASGDERRDRDDEA